MNREEMWARARDNSTPWDMVIVGGGATGLGTAVDASERGYRTILVEQYDFAKGTSSRSTKLVHGGVRYLKQGDISLVREALRERGLLRQNAPHLVNDLELIVPNYTWWGGAFYGVGLKTYDVLAGRLGLAKSRILSRAETLERIPALEAKGLRSGVLYHDGQFDDARLAIHLAMTAAEHGAALLNYAPVIRLLKSKDGKIAGVAVRDAESGEEFDIRAKVVVNATGVFTDGLRRMDEPGAPPLVRPSQGVHIVLDKKFMPGKTAIMVPHTDDGRVLFVLPWHDRVIVGTTDTPVPEASIEPRPLDEEIEFLMTHAARYLKQDPTRADVLCTYAALRPLVNRGGEGSTASLSRDHTIRISDSGLVSVTGGKWTTYRHMAEDTVNKASRVGALTERPCGTKDLKIHGYHSDSGEFGHLYVYGSDAPAIAALAKAASPLAALLHPRLPYQAAEVVWAARHEMARTVEDALARRTRALLLDARAAIEAAPLVAEILARELGRDAAWRSKQIREFTELADGYLLH